MLRIRYGRAAVALLALVCIASRAEESGQRFSRIEAYVDDYVRLAAFDGIVLIAEGDEVIWQRGFGFADYTRMIPMTPETRFRIASLSKQFTEAAIGRLADEGRLRLDDRLDTFLPDFPAADRITLRQLVDHTAGIAHTNTLDWMDMCRGMTLDEIVAGLAGEDLQFEPGTDRRYSNGGYALLAKVIEVAGGTSYGDFLHKVLPDYPSVGHEAAFAVVPMMAARYAPGPVYGVRVEAETYVTANRIGGGSLYADASDVWRFFRDSYRGELLSDESTAALFPKPADGDAQVTGRSPGALAQVYLDFDEDLAVVTLSSNSGWPGSFNSDIVALYRGEDAALTPFALRETPLKPAELRRYAGRFASARFGWEVEIAPADGTLVFVQGNVRTAFAPTAAREFHLPIYDWLCRYAADASALECRQRDPDAAIRFQFARL